MLPGDQRQNSFCIKTDTPSPDNPGIVVGKDQRGKTARELFATPEESQAEGGQGPQAERDQSCHSGQQP